MKPRIGAGWQRAEPGYAALPEAGTARQELNPRLNGGYRVSTDDQGWVESRLEGQYWEHWASALLALLG